MSAPIRVLQVVLSLSPGGAERLVIEIGRRLGSSFETVVCCLDEEGLWARQLRDRGIIVEALHRRPGFHPALGARIAALASRHEIDVVHCHQYTPFVYGRLATWLNSRARLVFTEHGRLADARRSVKRQLANRVMRRFDGSIYAVSADLKRHLIADGFQADRIGVIYNGVDPGPARDEICRRATRAALGIPPSALVVGSIARLDPVKELTTLIDAFALVFAARPQAKLVIVGEGPERASLEERARRSTAATAVHFLGHREDIPRLLPAFDVYANTSTSEGISLTILEAMAASLPVVATRVGGTPEIVSDGETGLLIPAGSPAALASAIEGLASWPDRRRRLGSAARHHVETRFTIDRMVREYADVYRRLARQPVPRQRGIA